MCIYFNCIYLKAQAPAIQWQKFIGGTLEDNLTEMITTVDEGYIIGVQTNTYNVNKGAKKTKNIKYKLF